MSKRCTRCRALKVADDSTLKTCDDCRASYNRYRADNLEKVRGKDRRVKHRYYAEHAVEHAAKVRHYIETHREQYNAYQARYNREHPERVRASASRRRARMAGAEGTFTHHDVEKQFQLQNGICFYCPRQLFKYHVDHKIPLSRGGTNWPSNLVCCCADCNLRKGTMTAEEFLSGCARASPSE